MERTVDAIELLRRLRPLLDPGPLGTVVSEVAGDSRRQLLQIMIESGNDDLLADADFFATACARVRLSTKRLLRHACAPLRNPGAAIALVGRMMAAGSLDVFTASASTQLNQILDRWPPIELRRALLRAIIDELDTFAQVGAFLRGILDSPACTLSGSVLENLLRAVMTDSASADLAGSPADMTAELPPEHAGLVAACLEHAADDAADDSEVDSDGNIAGFVVSDTDGDGKSTGCEDEAENEEDYERRARGARSSSAVEASPQSCGRPPVRRRLRQLSGGGRAGVKRKRKGST